MYVNGLRLNSRGTLIVAKCPKLDRFAVGSYVNCFAVDWLILQTDDERVDWRANLALNLNVCRGTVTCSGFPTRSIDFSNRLHLRCSAMCNKPIIGQLRRVSDCDQVMWTKARPQRAKSTQRTQGSTEIGQRLLDQGYGRSRRVRTYPSGACRTNPQLYARPTNDGGRSSWDRWNVRNPRFSMRVSTVHDGGE